jgi:hypothetical protein
MTGAKWSAIIIINPSKSNNPRENDKKGHDLYISRKDKKFRISLVFVPHTTLITIISI